TVEAARTSRGRGGEELLRPFGVHRQGARVALALEAIDPSPGPAVVLAAAEAVARRGVDDGATAGVHRDRVDVVVDAAVVILPRLAAILGPHHAANFDGEVDPPRVMGIDRDGADVPLRVAPRHAPA